MWLRPMRSWALLALLGLGACAGQRCEVMLTNRGRLAVEQLALTPEATGQPGPDLLTEAPLPPGGTMRLNFPTRGRYGLRAVLVNGRAVELAGLDGCGLGQLIIDDPAGQAAAR